MTSYRDHFVWKVHITILAILGQIRRLSWLIQMIIVSKWNVFRSYFGLKWCKKTLYKFPMVVLKFLVCGKLHYSPLWRPRSRVNWMKISSFLIEIRSGCKIHHFFVLIRQIDVEYCSDKRFENNLKSVENCNVPCRFSDWRLRIFKIGQNCDFLPIFHDFSIHKCCPKCCDWLLL